MKYALCPLTVDLSWLALQRLGNGDTNEEAVYSCSVTKPSFPHPPQRRGNVGGAACEAETPRAPSSDLSAAVRLWQSEFIFIVTSISLLSNETAMKGPGGHGMPS